MKSERKLEKYLEYSWNAAASHQKSSQYFFLLFIQTFMWSSPTLYYSYSMWPIYIAETMVYRFQNWNFKKKRPRLPSWVCVLLLGSVTLRGAVYYVVNSRTERPMWQGTEDSSQHPGKNRGLPATSWVSTETGSPALGEPWDGAALASSLTITPWETETEPLS